MYPEFDESYIISLFEQAENFLEDNPYRNIADAPYFYTKIVGVTMEGRQETIRRLSLDTRIRLQREPDNPYDHNAIMVITENNEHIGYLNRKLALVLAPLIDQGRDYQVFISSLTGGKNGNSYGVNILIVNNSHSQCVIDTGIRSRLAVLDDDALFEEIRKTILGEWHYHNKQLEAINSLIQGNNLLAIFGTGRGKSAIFQTMAAYNAIRHNQVTIIVYPLRALSNDQYYSMELMFSKFGLRVYKANGSLSTEERTLFYNAAKQNEVDIILTTPEFLLFNAKNLGPLTERIGLFVVDESHHIRSDSHRPAYKNLNRILEMLNRPQVLAVTATADDLTAREIVMKLGINDVIIDDYSRDNLSLVDSRGIVNKDDYLLKVVKNGKTIVYVGTRRESVRLASLIRESIPGFQYKVGFYHGGMASADRAYIEKMFRSGYLQCVVATSAFGEGINVPDVTDVVLYHMVYSFTEFNQQGGRAGRGGQPARIHVLFNKSDSIVNTNIISSQAPTRVQLENVYKALKCVPSNATNKDIAETVKLISKGKVRVNETTVSCCLGILEELALIIRETYGNKREIEVVKNPPKCNLKDSIRYQEGLRGLEEFNKFKRDVFIWSSRALEDFVKKPIYPIGNVLAKHERESYWLLDQQTS